MQKELKDRGLEIKGKKDELIKRLQDFLASQGAGNSLECGLAKIWTDTLNGAEATTDAAQEVNGNGQADGHEDPSDSAAAHDSSAPNSDQHVSEAPDLSSSKRGRDADDIDSVPDEEGKRARIESADPIDQHVDTSEPVPVPSEASNSDPNVQHSASTEDASHHASNEAGDVAARDSKAEEPSEAAAIANGQGSAATTTDQIDGAAPETDTAAPAAAAGAEAAVEITGSEAAIEAGDAAAEPGADAEPAAATDPEAAAAADTEAAAAEAPPPYVDPAAAAHAYAYPVTRALPAAPGNMQPRKKIGQGLAAAFL